jgi:hypothetical protein
MIYSYTQATYEGCLASCLLQAANQKPTKALEISTLEHSLNYSKDDFTAGHLDFVIKNFGVKVTRIVHYKLFLKYLQSIIHPKTELKQEKIDLKTIDKYLSKSPIILYIDSFPLFKVVHCPHFITLIEKIGSNYKIFDNWDGKTKTISQETLLESVNLLKNHLKFCPQIIIVQN